MSLSLSPQLDLLTGPSPGSRTANRHLHPAGQFGRPHRVAALDVDGSLR